MAEDWYEQYEVAESSKEREDMEWYEKYPAFDPNIQMGSGVPSGPPGEQADTFESRTEMREVARADIERQLGDQPFTFEEGLDNMWQRFRLSGGGRRDIDDQEKALREYMPDAEIKRVKLPDGTEKLAFRPPNEEAFRPVNAAGIDRGDIGSAASYLFNMENAVATVASGLTKTNMFPMRMLFTGLGAGAGRLADTAIDVASGDKTDPLSEIFSDAALSVVFGAGGEAAGTGLSRGLQFMTGRGMFNPSPGARQAKIAAEEEGLPPLTMGQTFPLAARREQQTIQVGDIVAQYRGGQLRESRRGLESQRGQITGQGAPTMSDEELESVVLELTLDLKRGINNPEVALREGGRALQRGRNTFEEVSREWVDRKYLKVLESAEDVRFDLSPVFDQMKIVKKGTPARGRGIDSGTGQPTTTRASAAPSGDLLNIMKRLDGMADVQEGAEGYQALKQIRTELGDIADGNWQDASSKERYNMRVAADLYDSVTQTISGAQSTSEGFQRMWNSANIANSWRERVLSADSIKKMVKEQNPAKLASTYAKPGEFSNLRLIKRMMPDENWKAFKDSFESRLLSQPEKIPQVLDDFRIEPEALNILMPIERQRQFRTLGLNARRLQQAQSEWARQSDAGERVIQMIDGGHIDEALRAVRNAGGPESIDGRRIRAGVFEAILRKSEAYDPIIGETVVDPRRASSVISDYINNTSLREVLTKTDMKVLENYRTYLGRLAESADFGASLSGAELSSTALNPLDPKGASQGWLKAASLSAIARGFTNPRVVRYIGGDGRKLKPITTVRQAATIASLIAKDVSEDLQPPEEQESP